MAFRRIEVKASSFSNLAQCTLCCKVEGLYSAQSGLSRRGVASGSPITSLPCAIQGTLWDSGRRRDGASDELRKIYQRIKGSRGKISNILSVHSLHPSALQAHMDLHRAILFVSSGLSREEREMVAVSVASTDQCSYCIQHHAVTLYHY